VTGREVKREIEREEEEKRQQHNNKTTEIGPAISTKGRKN